MEYEQLYQQNFTNTLYGFDSLLIEAYLSHTDQNEIRASYNRSDYLEQRKEIMYWWSDFIIDSCE